VPRAKTGYLLLGMLTVSVLIGLGWFLWSYWWIYTPAYQVPLGQLQQVHVLYKGHKLAEWSDAERLEQLRQAVSWYSGVGLPYATRCHEANTFFARLHQAEGVPVDIWLPLDDCLVINAARPKTLSGYAIEAPDFLKLLGEWLIEATGDAPLKEYPFLDERVVSRWHHWAAYEARK